MKSQNHKLAELDQVQLLRIYFLVNEDYDKLNKEKFETFHKLVAMMLFATKIARPDTGTAISYLTTRVIDPDQSNWMKMVHLFKFVRVDNDLPLILSVDKSGILKWYIDGSHVVHPNMRGHTGKGPTIKQGFSISVLSKQKLNTRSSTELENFGFYQLMPLVLWTRSFLEYQGYGVTENIIYQDNKGAILLENNDKSSSSRRTKHINIILFL